MAQPTASSATTTTSADPSFTSVRYVPTTEAYDRWAAVYDNDGNFLQALDGQALQTLFPRFAAAIRTPAPWRLVDLGCGTGRNTARLVGLGGGHEVIALDASRGMLEVARTRLAGLSPDADADADGGAETRPNVRLEVFDMLATPAADGDDEAAVVQPGTADAVISTLVAEHVPLATYFAHVSRMLRPGGVLLLTNMHQDMGRISQAGFVDPATGEKIRPTSYVHTADEVVREARRCGLEVEGGDGALEERVVETDMVGELGPRSAKWVGIACWFGGIFRKEG